MNDLIVTTDDEQEGREGTIYENLGLRENEPIDKKLLKNCSIYPKNSSRWHRAVNMAAYKICRKQPKLISKRDDLKFMVSRF